MSVRRPSLTRIPLLLAVIVGAGLVLAAACSSSDAGTPVSGVPASGAASFPPDDGKVVGKAPTFRGETFNHGAFDLSQKAGKPVVINFWFPSCPPCRAELPDLQAAYQEYGDEIEFIGVQQVGLDSAVAGEQFWSDIGVGFPAFPDDKAQVQTAYRVLSYPTTVFLNRDHVVVRKWTGLIDKDNLEKNIQAILKS